MRAFLLLAFTATAAAQQHITVPRSDGHQTPLAVYQPAAPPATGCAPLALISHGAGGSENGYAYLANSLAQHGYLAVVMGHHESGFEAVRASIIAHGGRSGIAAVVADPNAEAARLLDVTAALAWFENTRDKTCKPPFRVLLGHSMGAETTMLEAGARDMIHIAPGITGKSRFDAYVALSPEGVGVVFPANAWRDIEKPVLILTGTLDGAINGDYHTRLQPFANLPGIKNDCQWQGVITGATHMNFGGRGNGHDTTEPIITGTIETFLTQVRSGGHCTLPPPQPGFDLKLK